MAADPAARGADRELVERLLALGADPSLRDQSFDATPAGWQRTPGTATWPTVSSHPRPGSRTGTPHWLTFPPMVVRKLITGGALLATAAVTAVEVLYRRHPGNDLAFLDEDWNVERDGRGGLRVAGRLVVRNEIPDREVMLCDVRPVVRLLSDAGVDELTTTAAARSLRKDYPAREDGYWVAYVVKPGALRPAVADGDRRGGQRPGSVPRRPLRHVGRGPPRHVRLRGPAGAVPPRRGPVAPPRRRGQGARERAGGAVLAGRGRRAGAGPGRADPSARPLRRSGRGRAPLRRGPHPVRATS